VESVLTFETQRVFFDLVDIVASVERFDS